MPDIDNGADAQDEAEIFDETNREDELTLGGEDLVDDADVARDVYDVTSAIGDSDDDRYAMDAADAESEDLDADDLEQDEDDDDALDNDFEDQPEDDDMDTDNKVDRAAAASHVDEPGLLFAADLDPLTNPRDDEAEKYEATRPLSDAQLSDLGYRDDAEADRPGRAREEDRSFVESADDETIHGTGATADDVADESDSADEARLDEGLEETFPASDPVSAKHIT